MEYLYNTHAAANYIGRHHQTVKLYVRRFKAGEETKLKPDFYDGIRWFFRKKTLDRFIARQQGVTKRGPKNKP